MKNTLKVLELRMWDLMKVVELREESQYIAFIALWFINPYIYDT